MTRWLAIVVTLASCAGTAQRIVDGFTLGAVLKCSPPVDSQYNPCVEISKLAFAALDAREPGHLPVYSVETYADGSQPGPVDVTGESPPAVAASQHPGPAITVFLFTLSDGSRRATAVACSGARPSCVGMGAYPR